MVENVNILDLQESSNEVLLASDGFIQSIIALYLYERYPGNNEGFNKNKIIVFKNRDFK